MQTGYFANEKTHTKVHLVENGVPVCGCEIGSDKQFQWNAQGIQFRYIECEKCKKIAKILLKGGQTAEQRRKIPKDIALIPHNVFIHYCQYHGIQLVKITDMYAHVKMPLEDKISFTWTDGNGYTLRQAICERKKIKSTNIIAANSTYTKATALKICKKNLSMWLENGVSYRAQENTEFIIPRNIKRRKNV